MPPAMQDPPTGATPALPEADLLQQQAGWLAPARSQALRRAQIAQRRRVLDLGCGYGAVTPELVRRSAGRVIAFDLAFRALRTPPSAPVSPFEDVIAVNGTAAALPFCDAAFDLVFTQLALLWTRPLEKVLDEVCRVLAPGGSLVALEPDYEGMIEYPPVIATRALWITALRRAGAAPDIGRSLPAQLAGRGLQVHITLFDTLYPASMERFDFLRGLPLDAQEHAELARITEAAAQLTAPWAQLAHLPFFVITALKPTS